MADQESSRFLSLDEVAKELAISRSQA